MANQKSKGGDDGGPNARVGTVIKGKWKIEALLGVGGMAAVYAASHRNGQRAALKILHTDFAREKTICERFLREAYVSNKVNHGATVQVLDDDMTEGGEPFLIMELLEGETVRDAWKKSGRTMPGGRVLQICERVLDCLASCHAIKVIHRDLKPANVLLENGTKAIVVDFGTATTFDCVTPKGEYMGGVIAPGIQISADALFSRAAKLPRVEIQRPAKVVGRNTQHSMQSGIVYGYVGLVDGLVERIIEETAFPSCAVVATGGLARLIAPLSRTIHDVEDDLTLTGLRILHERNV